MCVVLCLHVCLCTLVYLMPGGVRHGALDSLELEAVVRHATLNPQEEQQLYLTTDISLQVPYFLS